MSSVNWNTNLLARFNDRGINSFQLKKVNKAGEIQGLVLNGSEVQTHPPH